MADVVAGDAVRAGRGHRPPVGGARRGARGQDERGVVRELVEEVRVRAGEVERDHRIVAGFGDDAVREIAGAGLSGALRGTDDGGKEVSPWRGELLERAQLPDSLEGGTDVAGTYLAAGRVADARPQHKPVCPA